MKKISNLAFGVSAAVVMFVATASAWATIDTPVNEREWKFNVYLDDSRIGHHHFYLAKHDDSWLITTEADFKVNFLVFTAYRYQHSNREVWRNNCLQQIDSTTNANGKPFSVSGSRNDKGFTIETNRFRDDLGECVKTFAYWNPEILSESRLLNSQTGELLPVAVTRETEEALVVKGEKVPAIRYHLEAKGMELDIWYSTDQRWLALESTVKGGRKLRYELT